MLLSHLDSISPPHTTSPRINTVFVVVLAHHCCLSKGRCIVAREIERACGWATVGLLGGGEPAVRQVEAAHWLGRRRRRDGRTQEEPRKCAEWRRPSSITARLCSVWCGTERAPRRHRGGRARARVANITHHVPITRCIDALCRRTMGRVPNCVKFPPAHVSAAQLLRGALISTRTSSRIRVYWTCQK